MTDVVHFDGWESSSRRQTVIEGGLYIVLPDGALLQGKVYEPKGRYSAVRMTKDFEIKGRHGQLRGRAGDYLVVGLRGEMFPMTAEALKLAFDEVVDVSFL